MAYVYGITLPDGYHYDARCDIGLIGCLTDAELFNGSCCGRAIPMPPKRTLLTDNKLREKSTAKEYGQIIAGFIAGYIDERTMWSRLSSLGKTR